MFSVHQNTIDFVSKSYTFGNIICSMPNIYPLEEIDNICKEMIECGIISKEGKFNTEFIKIKEFKQILDLKIDDKYMQYNYNDKKKCSEELINNINFIALKVNENTFNSKKMEIKDEIYSILESFIESIIERILNCIEDKVSEQFSKIYPKFNEEASFDVDTSRMVAMSFVNTSFKGYERGVAASRDYSGGSSWGGGGGSSFSGGGSSSGGSSGGGFR